MIQLTPDEARILGVLIEKAMTTPDQYPLTQNGAMNGANQKNNRDPILAMDEHRAFDALEGLRGKSLVVRVDQAGSRVSKYRHALGDVLHARTSEIAILAELLLRGPQTLGELRGRASRMHAFESLEAVKGNLDGMMSREEPLVRQLPPAPGSRAERFMQLLCPDCHPADAAPAAVQQAAPTSGATVLSLTERVTQLESEVTTLREVLSKFAQTLGEPDPFGQSTNMENGSQG